MGTTGSGEPDDVAASRPTGTVRIVLLSVVAALGFYLALTEETGRVVYLVIGVVGAALAVGLGVARGRRTRRRPGRG